MEFRRRKLKILPGLTDRHLQARITFATEHLSQATDWGKVIFSDEKHFKLNGPDIHNYVWTCLQNPEDRVLYSTSCLDKRGITVWLAFSSMGILAILRTHTTLTSDTYSRMVINEALPSFHAAHGDDFIFQQDNARPHVAALTLEVFENSEIRLLNWPALSPDLNPVENMWAIISRDVYLGHPQYSSLDVLWAAITRAAARIHQEMIDNLVGSMTSRCVKILLNQGRRVN